MAYESEDDEPDTHWLNLPIPDVNQVLLDRLGVKSTPWLARRHQILAALARHMGYNPERLRRVAHNVLDSMVVPLGDAMWSRRGDWVTLLEEEQHKEVVRRAMSELPSEDLHEAVLQFRVGRKPVRCDAADVDEARRELLVAELSGRLMRLLADAPRKAS